MITTEFPPAVEPVVGFNDVIVDVAVAATIGIWIPVVVLKYDEFGDGTAEVVVSMPHCAGTSADHCCASDPVVSKKKMSLLTAYSSMTLAILIVFARVADVQRDVPARSAGDLNRATTRRVRRA